MARAEAGRRVKEWKSAGLKIVFTNGCFDLLHPGHVRYLQKARSLGDRLVVAVNSDHSVRSIKGAGRPIQPELERAEVLAALAAVNLVTVFDEPDPDGIIREVLPDVLVKGADWPTDQIIGKDVVEAAGGQVRQIEFAPGYSTSGIIDKIRKNP